MHAETLAPARAACLLLGLLACGNPSLIPEGAGATTLRTESDPWVDGGAAEAGCALEASGNDVSLGRLLSEMVDLRHLTRLPEPDYSSHFWSSHDPASDAAAPGEEAWFANRDFLTLAAGETRELLEVEGPGVLTRLWSATPAGTLRVYLDGEEAPAIEAPLAELLRGDVPPFGEPFAFVAAGGHNLYFPIPFASRCRVTLESEQDARVYFHVSYRRYASEVEVESYSPQALQASSCVRETVAERLRGVGPASPALETDEAHSVELDTAEGDAETVIEAPSGGGAIWELRLAPEDVRPPALRETVVELSFDGVRTAMLPLGDLFAVGVEHRRVGSLPIGVTEDGTLIARWPMPFERQARVVLRAAGGRGQSFRLEARHGPRTFDARSLYFHAGWRAPETFPSAPPSDWLLADIEGDGLYVGNVLNVLNPAASWWGEGDEKISIDDETFPGHFGTGTEDYYGYAWCSNEEFSSGYIGQPLGSERQNFGASTLYRFHILDPLRFTSRLRFDMEVRHWGAPVDVTYDAASFWYARPGAAAEGMSIDPAQYRRPALSVEPPADVRPGAYRCG